MREMRRINPIGLEFYFKAIVGNDRTLAFVNVNDKPKQIIIDMQITEISQCWYHWQMNGEHIQSAFRGLPAEQREFLLTGITPKEWEEIFNDKEEQDETTDN